MNSNCLKMSVLSLLLIMSCSNLKTSPKPSSATTQPQSPASSVTGSAPKIPFIPEKAFFPIHPSGKGVYYSWRECTKRVIFCFNWERKEVIFEFTDAESMGWFKSNDFGFKKRQSP